MPWPSPAIDARRAVVVVPMFEPSVRGYDLSTDIRPRPAGMKDLVSVIQPPTDLNPRYADENSALRKKIILDYSHSLPTVVNPIIILLKRFKQFCSNLNSKLECMTCSHSAQWCFLQ